MKRWIDSYGDLNLRFEYIKVERTNEIYRGFHLLRGTVLTLQDSNGKEMELNILGLLWG